MKNYEKITAVLLVLTAICLIVQNGRYSIMEEELTRRIEVLSSANKVLSEKLTLSERRRAKLEFDTYVHDDKVRIEDITSVYGAKAYFAKAEKDEAEKAEKSAKAEEDEAEKAEKSAKAKKDKTEKEPGGSTPPRSLDLPTSEPSDPPKPIPLIPEHPICKSGSRTPDGTAAPSPEEPEPPTKPEPPEEFDDSDAIEPKEPPVVINPPADLPAPEPPSPDMIMDYGGKFSLKALKSLGEVAIVDKGKDRVIVLTATEYDKNTLSLNQMLVYEKLPADSPEGKGFVLTQANKTETSADISIYDIEDKDVRMGSTMGELLVEVLIQETRLKY